MTRRFLLSTLLAALLTPAAAHAQVALVWKPPSRDVVTHSSGSVDQTLNVGGMDLHTLVDSRIVSRTSAGAPAADGTLRIAEKTEKMVIDLALPGGMKAHFDSSAAENKSDLPQLQSLFDTYKTLTQSPYTLVLKEREIVGIEGVDKLIAAAPPAAADAVKAALSPEKLKQTFRQELGRLPDNPVKAGDRWLRTEVMDLGAGQTLTFQVYYEYTGTVVKDGKTLDKIGIFASEVAYAVDPNGALPVKVSSSDLKVESSVGSVLFDREAGMVVETSHRVRITGPLTLTTNGMDIPSKLDLTIDMSSATAPAKE